MYRICFCLFLSWSMGLALAQSTVDLHSYVMSNGLKDIQVITHPNGQEGLILLKDQAGAWYIQVIGPNGPLREAQRMVGNKHPAYRSLYEVLGYQATKPGHYQVIFRDIRMGQLSSLAIRTKGDSIDIELIPLAKFHRREEYLGSVTSGRECVVATVNKRSSVVHLYYIDPTGSFLQWDYDLRDAEEPFDQTPFNSLASALVIPDDERIPLGAKAVGISPLRRTHPSSQKLVIPGKLYHEPGHAILTLDRMAAYTLVLDFPLDGTPPRIQRIAHEFMPCQDGMFDRYHLASSYANGLLLQAVGCKEGLHLRFYDWHADTLQKAITLSRERFEAGEFTRSDQVQPILWLFQEIDLSGDPSPGELPSYETSSEAQQKDVKEFFRNLETQAPLVSMLPANEGISALQIQATRAQQGKEILSYLVIGASTRWLLPLEVNYTSAVRFETGVELSTFTPGKAVNTQKLTSHGRFLLDTMPEDYTYQGLFQVGNTLWMLHSVQGASKMYALRGVTIKG